MNIRNTTALVTGANRGLGKSSVAALLDAGAARVYAGARDPATLAATVAIAPDRVVPLALDVTNPDHVVAAAAAATDVRLLINNAGALGFGNVLDAAFERDFAVNLYGTLAMARAFTPVLTSNGGGAMVNLLSVVALASMPGLAGYNASKAALWSVTQSLRGSLAASGIAVHGVFPGPVDTDMAAALDIAKTSPADVALAILAGIEAGDEDIFPDAMAQQVYAAWKTDHKAVERQFAAM